MARSGSDSGGSLPGGTTAKARLLAFAAAACLAGSFGLLTWLSFIGGPQAHFWVQHIQDVMAAIDELSTTLRDAESGQRGYLLTGRNQYLVPYLNARGRIPQMQARLLRLTADDASQQARLQGLAPLVERRMAELSETVQARREVGAEAALAVVGTDLGRQSMVEIGAALAEARATEAGLLTRRRYAAEYAEGVTRWVALGCAGLAVALLALAGRLLARERARARDLLATLDLGVFMARDPGGEIRFWSEGCARLYGWTAAEAVGQVSHALLRTVFPQPLAEVERRWSAMVPGRAISGSGAGTAARSSWRRAWCCAATGSGALRPCWNPSPT